MERKLGNLRANGKRSYTDEAQIGSQIRGVRGGVWKPGSVWKLSGVYELNGAYKPNGIGLPDHLIWMVSIKIMHGSSFH